MIKNFIFTAVTLFLFLMGSIGLYAQDDSPVSWSAAIHQVSDNIYEIKLTGQIADGWHIYDLKDYGGAPISTELKVQGKVKVIGKPYLLSKAHVAYDEAFKMKIGTCEGNVVIGQKIEISSSKNESLKLMVSWQTCRSGECLAPEEEEISIKVPAAIAVAGASKAVESDLPAEQIDTQAVDTASVPVATADTVPSIKKNAAAVIDGNAGAIKDIQGSGKSLWGVIIEAILWGFVALLTPCVFPMVPMTVSFFLKNAGGKKKGRFMAALYGASIVGLYTLPIAVIIFVTYMLGGDSGIVFIFNWLATHWIPNIIFFIIFMLFAASFFGAFEITMPSWMVNKADAKSDKGGILGVFFMALTLVLVSFSCTGPIVGTILIKSTQGEIWEPIITMLAFSVAFALPFTIFAFVPSLLKDLPKSGGWLNSVKVVLGFLELALGLKFLSVADQVYGWGLLDREVYLAIWIVVFTLLGLYLLGKIRFAYDSPVEHVTVPRLIMAIVVFTFVVYMLPGMWGAPLKAISGYLPPIETQDFRLNQNGAVKGGDADNSGSNAVVQIADPSAPVVKYGNIEQLKMIDGLSGFYDYNQALDYSAKVGKPVFLDFTGKACVNCREMEARVLSDARVQKILREKYVVLEMYGDVRYDLPEDDWVITPNGKILKSIGKINTNLLMSKYGVNAMPYYLLLDSKGNTIVPPRGYDLDVNAFIKYLESGIR